METAKMNISKEAAMALVNGKSLSKGDTIVQNGKYFFKGVEIGRKDKDTTVYINFNGQESESVRRRINAICKAVGRSTFIFSDGDILNDEGRESINDWIPIMWDC